MVKSNLIVLLLFASLTLFAQNTVQNILLQNVTVDGKMLEIVHQQSDMPLPVLLVWVREDNTQGQHILTLQPGKNKVLMNFHPLWNGHLRALGTTDPNITASLIDVTLIDQISALFSPLSLTPGSINFAPPNFLFGYSLRYVLLVIIALFAVIGIILKLDWRLAIYMGFTVSVLILLTQQVYQEYSILDSYKANNNTLQPFTPLAPFVAASAPVIKGQSWSKTRLSGVYNSYVKYHFAEESFLPQNEASKNLLLVTDAPKNNEVIVNQNGFYLTRK